MNDYFKEKSIEYAIKAQLEHDKDSDGNSIPNVDKLIEGARKIEAYLKEEKTDANV